MFVSMKSNELITALNQTATDVGLIHWIPVNSIYMIPNAMQILSSVLWVKQFPENNNTKLIREQSRILFEFGKLVFEDDKINRVI